MTTPAPPPCTPACSGGGGSPTTVTAGPGAVVTGDPTAGYTVSALSTGAGQVLTEGPDGGVFLDCAAVAACVPGGGGSTVVTPGAGAYMTGNGDPATPYVVNALSADVDNILIEGADGGVKLDCAAVAACGGGAAPVTGCGLSGTGTAADPLVADVATWPHACPESSGGDVFCDPATGQLKVDPPRQIASGSVPPEATVLASHTLACGGVEPVATRTAALVLNNPDPCRSMTFRVDVGGRMRVDVPVSLDANTWTINAIQRVQINGGGFVFAENDTHNQHAVPDDTTTRAGHLSHIASQLVTVPPGGAITVDTQVAVSCLGLAGQTINVVYNLPGVTAMGWS